MLGAFTRGLLAFLGSLPLCMFLAGALLGPSMSPMGMVLSAAFTVLFVRLYGYPRVVIGADGIRLVGRLVPRFIPFADLTGARLRPGDASGVTGVEVTRSDGRTFLLPTIAQTEDAEHALVERIRAGIEAYAKGGDDRLLGALERRGRPVPVWKEDLRRLAQAEGGFRQQAIGREDFERVLADPSAPADRRVGAALALEATVDETAKDRIRVAAAASASPPLRIALEAAADGEVDEEAVDEALAAHHRGAR
jgi:hypothetical protein